MAFHTTSMRAKEALRSFRSRSGAGRQRAASAVPRLETSKPVSTDGNISVWQPRTNPEICSTEMEDGQGARDVEEETREVEDESSSDTTQVKGSDGMEGSENDSVFETEELELQENHSLQR